MKRRRRGRRRQGCGPIGGWLGRAARGVGAGRTIGLGVVITMPSSEVCAAPCVGQDSLPAKRIARVTRLQGKEIINVPVGSNNATI
jgi:hypothetical protein